MVKPSVLRVHAALWCALLVAGTCVAGTSSKVDRLGWIDLVPRGVRIANPFTHLPPLAQSAVRDLIWIRKSIENGRDPTELEEMELDARRQIESAGGDYASVSADVDDILEQSNAYGRSLVEDLDGRVVKMPGFALPLEFTGTAVTEFLLVPYVGACIHVPPPPPNQIVHVRSAKGFQISELYMPVWVTGRMSAKPSTQNLTYVDGTAPVDAGYSILARGIEPYRSE